MTSATPLRPAIQASSTVTLDGDRVVKSVVFSSTNAYTISPGTGGALSDGRRIHRANRQPSMSAPVTLPNASTVSVLNATDSLTISGTVGGAGGITKIGLGKLVLAGANTFAGVTNVNAGTLELNSTGANAIAGNIALTAGGTLRLLQSEQISNASSVNVSSGTFDLGANSETVAGSANRGRRDHRHGAHSQARAPSMCEAGRFPPTSVATSA